MRRYLSLIFLLSFILAVPIHATLEQTTPVYACSGGGGTANILYLLEDSDIVVEAQIIDSDDIRENGIAKVSSYVVGDAGSEYLAIKKSAHSYHHAHDMGDAKTCYIPGKPMVIGDSGLLFLRRDNDGSYQTVASLDYMSDEANAVFDVYYYENTEENYTRENLTISEIINWIGELTGSEPVQPDFTLPASLHAPLLIQTSTGANYVMPYDLSKPVLIAQNPDDIIAVSQELAVLYPDHVDLNLYNHANDYLELKEFAPQDQSTYCTHIGCFGIGGRGLYIIRLSTENEIEIYRTTRDDSYTKIEGQAFNSAPARDLLAVWNNSYLDMYFLSNYHDIREWQVDLYGEITLNIPSDVDILSLARNSVWSNDGTQFAYSDADGLWLWQSFETGNAPHLVIPANDDIPIAQYFSPRGRYLTITQGDEQFTLDLYSNARFPYGVVSPNEQFLAWYAEDEDVHQLVFCYLRENNCDTEIWLWQAQEVIWTTSSKLLILGCDLPDYCGLHGFFAAPNFSIGSYSSFSFETRDWDTTIQMKYEPIGDNLAILNNGTTISIMYDVQNQYRTDANKFITLDLSESIDGEIVSIEWLPSHFYMYE